MNIADTARLVCFQRSYIFGLFDESYDQKLSLTFDTAPFELYPPHGVQVRTYIIDELVKNEIRERDETLTILTLGSGLCTRALRIGNNHEWLEVDDKRFHVQKLKVFPDYPGIHIATDCFAPEVKEHLDCETVVIAEGLFVYLPYKEQSKIIEMCTKRHATLIVDYMGLKVATYFKQFLDEVPLYPFNTDELKVRPKKIISLAHEGYCLGVYSDINYANQAFVAVY